MGKKEIWEGKIHTKKGICITYYGQLWLTVIYMRLLKNQ